ncbi:jg8754 [Pararge aegeria aegeria]|uniref:Jg8754 protein n=1 Tax=Pararge aegeria aegeria TaxID=348720 RepID=A0A8S4S2Y9_9NEOP|nr:jg8754 [Pararge aegeria aegeria]
MRRLTEREVINGVLNVKNTKNHCLAYVRYINNINLQNLKKASNFVDILNRSLDAEASKLLADLRDVRLPNKIETTNIQKYTVEWIGRDGLDNETHGEYLNHFISHFYKNIIKLVDRAMRKEDSSAQGQIVTEILQHLHACNNSVKVFHGREDDLNFIENYMLNDSDKPLVLYGEGGCGKTSLLAKSSAMSLNTWFAEVRPTNIIRFLGTTPDSSALTPTLISICQQISYNFALPFEGIPDDLVPLTAHFKQLLTMASQQQPLLLYLDSVDQLTGIGTENNKVSWLPTRLPPHCKIIVTCACEETNPEVSKEYDVLRRMIDSEENFLEVKALGEDLAMQVLKLWMASAARDLSNYQWRLVSNAIGSCSLPIFVKLVFAEVCRWRSYTKPTDTHLASTVMDSIMMLFERIEKQHGRLLVFHALAYITAARSGLSETELEDLISLDDKVLDDVYQYHLPPVRRIPPLLWTSALRVDKAVGEHQFISFPRRYNCLLPMLAVLRIELKTFHSDREVNVMYGFHFPGIWGGGTPKPFKYTEIQRHRFNLADREGVADRKVPLQPLVFTSADGSSKRYNLRKFGELPFHLVRSKRFTDLYAEVLFNYEWLHAKLNCCPLQAVLADFEDAKLHVNKDAVRELMLVADALRLGGAILGAYPDMLAPQLVGRLLPEAPHNPAVSSLLHQCHDKGKNHCALLPSHHCLHTPGGPLKLHINDLLKPGIFGYADDSTVTVRYMSSPRASGDETLVLREALVERVNLALSEVSDWGDTNLVQFNASKTQACLFSAKRSPFPLTLTFRNVSVPTMKSIELLGISISTNVSFGQCIESKAKTAGKKLGILNKVKRYFTPEQLLTLYQAQVRSCMEYCSHLWDGSAKYQLDALDSVDRRARRLIGNDLVVSRLQSLEHRRKVACLAVFYKINFVECAQELFDLVKPSPFYHRTARKVHILFQYSLEGHQFAVFGIRLSSDKRYVVSISSRVISWDLSTSDLARDLCPQLEGIMQNLELSPDNKWAAACTNNSVSILLNMLTSEYITIENPLDEGETVRGVYALNHHFFIYGPSSWVQYSMRGEIEDTKPVPDATPYDDVTWEILLMEFRDLENFVVVMWSGDLDDDRLLVHFCKSGEWIQPLRCRGAMTLNKHWTRIYTSDPERGYQISIYELNEEQSCWDKVEELNHRETDTAEAMLQLKRGKKDRMLLATTTYSFVVWDFNNVIPRGNHESEKKNEEDNDKKEDEEEAEKQDTVAEKDMRLDGIVLKLPHTIRNISTKMTLSNSFMISNNNTYAVAGVRKSLYVWSLETTKLIKILDAHFGRIVQLEPLTVGAWNNVITSSIDRTVKIWNIDNIFEQVHKIDRQELPIDSISLARDQQLAVTVTRSCWGLWDTSTGRLLAQLADAPLGAIVTHAVITPTGDNVITAESGNVVMWDTPEKQVIFKEEQKGVKQLLLLEDGTKLITISMVVSAANVDNVAIAHIVARTIPDGERIYTVDYEVRGTGYRAAVVSADEHHIVAPGMDKSSRECLHVFHARTGARLHRIPIKNSGIKDMQSIVALPHKPHWVAVVGNDKAGILDIKTKRHVRFVPRWNGACTRDGKTGLCAPSRGGLDLIELKRGSSVQQLISRAAEGVFSIITMFSSTDDYVFYYHSGRKTLRVFRTLDGKAIAEYRAPAEVTGVASAHAGKALAIASQDGCLTVLNIVDPHE